MWVDIPLTTPSTDVSGRPMFIASRFLGGVGGAFGVGPYWITELAHPQHRAIVTTIYNTCYAIGAIIAAWATYGTLTIQSQWAWRLPSLLQFVTPAIQFSLIWFVPESPRYLINKDKSEQAKAILQKYHGPASGQEFVDAEFAEIVQTIQLEKQYSKNGWRQMWSTKGMRRRLAILVCLGLFANTAGNGLLSYYLHQVLDSIGIKSSRTQLQFNGALQIYNWVISLGITFFVDIIGRRNLFLTSIGGMVSFAHCDVVRKFAYADQAPYSWSPSLLGQPVPHYTMSIRTHPPLKGSSRAYSSFRCSTTSHSAVCTKHMVSLLTVHVMLNCIKNLTITSRCGIDALQSPSERAGCRGRVCICGFILLELRQPYWNGECRLEVLSAL